jgi:hypothetical protein
LMGFESCRRNYKGITHGLRHDVLCLATRILEKTNRRNLRPPF